jgi:hypothetical protein
MEKMKVFKTTDLKELFELLNYYDSGIYFKKNADGSLRLKIYQNDNGDERILIIKLDKNLSRHFEEYLKYDERPFDISYYNNEGKLIYNLMKEEDIIRNIRTNKIQEIIN